MKKIFLFGTISMLLVNAVHASQQDVIERAKKMQITIPGTKEKTSVADLAKKSPFSPKEIEELQNLATTYAKADQPAEEEIGKKISVNIGNLLKSAEKLGWSRDITQKLNVGDVLLTYDPTLEMGSTGGFSGRNYLFKKHPNSITKIKGLIYCVVIDKEQFNLDDPKVTRYQYAIYCSDGTIEYPIVKYPIDGKAPQYGGIPQYGKAPQFWIHKN